MGTQNHGLRTQDTFRMRDERSSNPKEVQVTSPKALKTTSTQITENIYQHIIMPLFIQADGWF